jgi:hypothetical protein
MTMLLQVGLALLVIWIMNIMFILIALLQHTPNWRDKDTESSDLLQNFITNATIVQVQMLQNAIKMNPFFGFMAVVFIVAAIVI